MIYWGINALNHGSSISAVRGDQLLYYAFDKSDELESSTFRSVVTYGGPDKIFWYERPWLKKNKTADSRTVFYSDRSNSDSS